MNITFVTNNILNKLKFKSNLVLISEKKKWISTRNKKKYINFISLYDNG